QTHAKAKGRYESSSDHSKCCRPKPGGVALHHWQADKRHFRPHHHQRSITIEASRCRDVRATHPKISHNYDKSSGYLRCEIDRVITPCRDEQQPCCDDK